MIRFSINNDPSELVSSKHICYFAKEEYGDVISLYEVVEEHYRHPDAPAVAVIPIVVTRLVESRRRSEKQAAAIILLEAAQNNIKD